MKAPVAALLWGLAAPAVSADATTPSYRWVEAGYGGQRAFADDNVSLSAPNAFRIAGNVQMVPHVYLLASYTSADYSQQRTDMTSAGVGGYLPLSPALHGIAQLTFERIEGDAFSEDGFGIEAGVRWRAPAVEFSVTAEHLRLETDFFGPEEEDNFTGLNLAAAVPLSETIGLTIRIEQLLGTGGVSADAGFDTYLVGLSYRF